MRMVRRVGYAVRTPLWRGAGVRCLGGLVGRPCCSFLVRCWQLGNDMQRFEIEHIQSGDRTVVASAAAAGAWIGAHAGATGREPAAPDGEGTAIGDERSGGADDR